MSKESGYSQRQDGLNPYIDNSILEKNHLHVDTSSVTLIDILAQLGEGSLFHPIAFSSRKLSTIKMNYTTTEREGLAMVYSL